jgi:FlaA1/EpsC-like NDP-sugar epimerase
MIALINDLTQRILYLPQWAKWAIAITLDASLCLFAVWVSFYLRLGEWTKLTDLQWLAVACSIAIAIPLLIVAGVYRGMLRYSGAATILAIAQAMLVYGAIYAAIITLIQIDTIPRTVGIIQPAILFILLACSRVLIGWCLGGPHRDFAGGRGGRAFIYGAGSAGRQLLQALTGSEMKVVGFLDDDPRLQGRTMLGKPINSPDRLEELVQRYALTHILLALPSASRRRRNEILELIRPLKVKVQTLPAMADVALGRVRVSELKDLDIDDLLGRDVVSPSPELLRRKIHNKIVMVTGAGGSIGSELCRQIVKCEPRMLLLLDSSEAALFAIQQELESLKVSNAPSVEVVGLLGSVTNRDRMRSILSAFRPDTVYHAAAYKHVPLVEHNPLDGIYNNVFGTVITAELCQEVGVSDFVLISTDKAVRPTNVMGASKRLAELALQAIADRSEQTCFSMVRFGNVLGSSGSVVPLFRKQIAAGGPITVTHEEMTRYFMSIPEAAQLVIQAGAMARGGEVFVLEMGEPVRIVDLARRMIELSGLKPDDGTGGDIDIVFTGLRPGEKLYEELLIGQDPKPTDHPRIAKANEPFFPLDTLRGPLEEMRLLICANKVESVLAMLQKLVVEYTPERQIVDHVNLYEARGVPAKTALPSPLSIASRLPC